MRIESLKCVEVLLFFFFVWEKTLRASFIIPLSRKELRIHSFCVIFTMCLILIVSIYHRQLHFSSNKRILLRLSIDTFASAESQWKPELSPSDDSSPIHSFLLGRNGREIRRRRSCEHKKGWCDYDVVNAGKWRMMLCFTWKKKQYIRCFVRRWTMCDYCRRGMHYFASLQMRDARMLCTWFNNVTQGKTKQPSNRKKASGQTTQRCKIMMWAEMLNSRWSRMLVKKALDALKYFIIKPYLRYHSGSFIFFGGLEAFSVRVLVLFLPCCGSYCFACYCFGSYCFCLSRINQVRCI